MRSFEDFKIEETVPLGPVTVSADDIVAFAEAFDPQPFHLDEEAGKESLLGGLAASGWHVCSLFMAMFVESVLRHSQAEGAPGMDYVKWKKPVLAGDTLRGTTTVKNKRVSRSRPEIGLVQMVHRLTNQRGELVCELANTGMFRRRDRS